MANEITWRLEHEKIGRLLLFYAIPAVIGTMVNALYNIVDRVFIGQGVGPLAISGLTLTFPILLFLQAFGMLIGAGAATHISICLGRKDTPQAERILGNALTLTFIISALTITPCMIFMDPLLKAFGGSEQTIPYAKDYLYIVVPGNILATLSFSFNAVMRASGYPKKAMLTSLVTVFVNIILAPIFIFSLGWGIKGAAVATLISQACGLLWILNHFFNKNSVIHFKRGIFHLDGRIISNITSIGMSPFLMNVCSCIIVIILNTSFQKYGGDYAIGAYGIVNRVVMLFVMIEVGLTQGMQPIIGYNYGALRMDRVLKTLRYAVTAGVGIMTFGFLMAEVFPGYIVAMFTDHSELTDMAKIGMRIVCVLYPLVGAQIVITNFFQSIGKAKVSIFLSLSRQLLFLIPGLLIIPRFWGINGVWASMPVADAVSVLVTLGTLFYFYRKGLFDSKRLV